MKPLSLAARVVGLGTLMLVVSLTTVGVALHQWFVAKEIEDRRARLASEVYWLLASVENETSAIVVMDERVDPRLSVPGAEVAAAVYGPAGVVWASSSFAELPDPPPVTALGQLTERRFPDLACADMRVEWPLPDDRLVPLQLRTCERHDVLEARVARFRERLASGFGLMSLLLLIVSLVTFRWSLRPVRAVGQALDAVKRGAEERLEGVFPRELRALTQSINALLEHEGDTRRRYRRAMDDLAHSLKTPLAVLQGRARTAGAMNSDVQAELERMQQIIKYQLGRAGSAGRSLYAKPVPVAPILGKVIASLEKVYADRSIEVDANISETTMFFGEEGDLYEILGNLLDNAFKYGVSMVAVTVQQSLEASTQVTWTLRVEDDGPGLPVDDMERVVARGQRGDSRLPGQGLGLGLVSELVEDYKGRLEFGLSRLGGASVSVTL